MVDHLLFNLILSACMERVEDSFDFEKNSNLSMYERKKELEAEHTKYIKEHPEFHQILHDFMQALLIHKPEDIMKDHFTAMKHTTPVSHPESGPAPESQSWRKEVAFGMTCLVQGSVKKFCRISIEAHTSFAMRLRGEIWALEGLCQNDATLLHAFCTEFFAKETCRWHHCLHSFFLDVYNRLAAHHIGYCLGCARRVEVGARS